jgi:hypothetical protein
MLSKRKLYDVRAIDRCLDQRSGFTQPLVSNEKWLGRLMVVRVKGVKRVVSKGKIERELTCPRR